MTEPAALPQSVSWKRVIAYYVVVYLASYGSVLGFLLAGGSFKDPSWVLFAQVSSLMPALVALALTRWRWHRPLVFSLAMRLRADRWLLVAWLLPWGLALLALGFGLVMPGTTFDGSLRPAVERTILSQSQLELLQGLAAKLALPPVLLLLPMGLLTSVTMSFIAGCGEEIGWRGFLYTELRSLGFWRATLITGVFWLGWHLPLLAIGYGYPQHPALGVLLMTAHLLILSVGLAYLRERGASSIVCGLFHGTMESAALLAVGPVRGGSDITVGIGSLSWTAAVAVVVLALLLYDRFLAREPIAWTRRQA
jgi:membrane protease YdiL (CAAX protease family)